MTHCESAFKSVGQEAPASLHDTKCLLVASTQQKSPELGIFLTRSDIRPHPIMQARSQLHLGGFFGWGVGAKNKWGQLLLLLYIRNMIGAVKNSVC